MLERLRRSATLDAIRGLAITQVFLWHIWIPALPNYLAAALNLAWSGVDLFFVLSGYLIAGILIDHRDATNYFAVFYGRRFLRIAPLYIVIIAGVSLYDGRVWWPYLWFGQNFYWSAAGNWGPEWTNVTWSLAVEEQFYLVLPLLIRLTPPAFLARAFAACIVMAPVARLIAVKAFGHPIAAYQLMPCRMDALFLGALAAWAIRQPAFVEKTALLKPLLRAGAALGGAGMIAMLIAHVDELSPVMHTVGYTWIDLFYFCVLLLAVTGAPPGAWLTAIIRPFSLLGLGAYSIYLFHRPIWIVTEGLLGGLGRLSMGATTIVTIAAAVACWTLIERPLIRWGHLRLRYEG